MNFEDYLKLKREQLRKTNLNDLLKNIDKGLYDEKINSLCKKNPDLDFSDIKDRIKNQDSCAIALIRKDTIRQNVSENAFFEYVGIEKLPPTGKKAVRFNGSKSADFKIKDWYGTQKYIQEPGGSQDNQINDAVYFAKECNKAGNKSIVCIDGEYGKKKIKELLKENDSCIILTADELKEGILNGRFK